MKTSHSHHNESGREQRDSNNKCTTQSHRRRAIFLAILVVRGAALFILALGALNDRVLDAEIRRVIPDGVGSRLPQMRVVNDHLGRVPDPTV